MWGSMVVSHIFSWNTLLRGLIKQRFCGDCRNISRNLEPPKFFKEFWDGQWKISFFIRLVLLVRWKMDLLSSFWYIVSVSGGHIEHCVTQGHYQWWTYWTLCDTRLLSMVDILNPVWHKVIINGGRIEHCVTQGHYQWWTYWTLCDTRSVSVVVILNTVWHKVIINVGHIENCVTQCHYQWWTYWTLSDTRSVSVVDILNTVTQGQ
jgi:hypothetical protein